MTIKTVIFIAFGICLLMPSYNDGNMDLDKGIKLQQQIMSISTNVQALATLTSEALSKGADVIANLGVTYSSLILTRCDMAMTGRLKYVQEACLNVRCAKFLHDVVRDVWPLVL